jgi:hypothetical protein
MSTPEAESDCCRKTRSDWERKIALYYSSFPVIKNVKCQDCTRILEIRVYEAAAASE